MRGLETWMEKKGRSEFARGMMFALFSASAGIIEIASFSALNELTELPYWPCYLTALVLSILWNFVFNRRFTFRSASNVPRAMALVFAFYLVFTPVTTVLGNYLAETLLWNEYLVTGLNMALNLVSEYIYDRRFVYRDSIDTNDLAQRSAEPSA